VEKERMKNRRAAALEEAGTHRMVGASLAKKVALFFSQAQHTAKIIFTKRHRHVNSKDNLAVGAMSGDKDTTAVTGDDEAAGKLLLLDPPPSLRNRFLPPFADSKNFPHRSEAIGHGGWEGGGDGHVLR
jgi:hypothetical protein